MTIVVLADIHAHYAALEAAVHRIDVLAPDGVVLLGDYITDCPHPRRTMELIYGLRRRFPTWMVRGNREDYLIAHRQALRENRDDGWIPGSGTGALLYTYGELTEDDLDFIEALPASVDIALPGCPVITACHASPTKTKDWIIGNDEKIRDAMKHAAGDMILCGHAHRTVRYDRYGKTLLVCPSLGIPQDRNDSSVMTVLRCTGRRWTRDTSRICTHVTYDLAGFLREFDASGLTELAPVWSACVKKSITDRQDYPAQCATIAYRRAREDGIYTVPPEEYWHAAAREIGVE
ncbi:MAG: metallophosphoesterase [Clostridia bacterium]|nr:metallophosphoesterase [Clostridia bacterium]